MSSTEWQVFVGRFQPPNNGHKDILRLAFESHPGPFLLGVVWAQSYPGNSSLVRDNPKHSPTYHPFTVWERVHMLNLIVNSLRVSVDVRISVVPRYDLPHGQVFRGFMPANYRRWTTDKDEEDASSMLRWESRGEKAFLLKLPFRPVASSDLRESMSGSGQWRPYIPEECWDYFESIDGPRRALPPHT